jgi:hypothetical protein
MVKDRKSSEWIKEMPIPYLKELLVKNRSYDDLSSGLWDAIDKSFNWAGTKQGNNFWTRIYDFYKMVHYSSNKRYNYIVVDCDIKEGDVIKTKNRIFYVLLVAKDNLLDVTSYVYLLGENIFTYKCILKVSLENFKKIQTGKFTINEDSDIPNFNKENKYHKYPL